MLHKKNYNAEFCLHKYLHQALFSSSMYCQPLCFSNPIILTCFYTILVLVSSFVQSFLYVCLESMLLLSVHNRSKIFDKSD